MKIITINLSEPHVKALKMLQDLGLYPSRSEAIRVAIRDFLKRGFNMTADTTITDTTDLKQTGIAGKSQEEIKKEIALLKRKLEDPLTR